MKKILVMIALSLFTLAVPVFAMDHGASHESMDAQCKKECEMLLKNCTRQVDSIQQRISKLQTEINEKGASTYTRDELKKLEQKLQEANETLRTLQTR